MPLIGVEIQDRTYTVLHVKCSQLFLNYQQIAIQLMKFVANVCSFPGLNLKENYSNGRGDMGKIYIGLQVKGP
jgi:hypothetical protein